MIRTLFERAEKRSLSFQDIWGRGLNMTDARTTSGEVVNYDSALALSAVFAATRLLSDTISTLPVDITSHKTATKNTSDQCQAGLPK